MIQILLRRVHLNFLRARLWVGCTILFSLSILALLVGVSNYKEEVSLFEGQRNADLSLSTSSSIVTYAQAKIAFHRPPEPLRVLSQGLGERFGSVVILSGRYGPPVILSRTGSNFLLPAAAEIDFSFVFMIVSSLLAILLATDIVTGERSAGTLQLIIASNVPRWKLLVGEYLGVMLSIAIPVGVGLVFAVTLIAGFGIAPPGSDLLLRWLELVSVFGFTISVFVLLGLWASVITRESATSLVMGFFFWVALVVFWPAICAWLMAHHGNAERSSLVHARSLLTDTLAGHRPTNLEMDQEASALLNRNLERAKSLEGLLRLSPFPCALLASQTIAGTDLGEHSRFLSESRRLDQAFADWQQGKVDRYPAREYHYGANQDPLDVSGLPESAFTRPTAVEVSGALVTSVGILLLWNIFCFTGLQLSFARYDVRAF